jgi:hypothetical protein
MKAYVMTTGSLFGLITAAHGYEVLDRGRVFGSDAAVVVVAASLAVWAWRVVRAIGN